MTMMRSAVVLLFFTLQLFISTLLRITGEFFAIKLPIVNLFNLKFKKHCRYYYIPHILEQKSEYNCLQPSSNLEIRLSTFSSGSAILICCVDRYDVILP